MSMSSNTNSSALSNDDYYSYVASAVYSFMIYFFLPLLILITLIVICVSCRQCYLAYTRHRRQATAAAASASIQVDISSLPTTRTYAETSTCAICLGEYKDDADVERVLTQCGHVFHRSCLHRWLTTDHATCPICRASTVAPPVASAVN